MKKLLSVTALVLIFALVLSACNMNMDMSPQAEPFVKEMLTALTAEDAEAAKALLHPSREDDAADTGIAAMGDLLGGREVESCLQTGFHFSSQMGGTGGARREESGTVRVTLTDGTVLQLNYTWLSNNGGEGFTTFQLAVGV